MQSGACSDSAEASRMSMERSFMKREEKALEREEFCETNAHSVPVPVVPIKNETPTTSLIYYITN